MALGNILNVYGHLILIFTAKVPLAILGKGLNPIFEFVQFFSKRNAQINVFPLQTASLEMHLLLAFGVQQRVIRELFRQFFSDKASPKLRVVGGI